MFFPDVSVNSQLIFMKICCEIFICHLKILYTGGRGLAQKLDHLACHVVAVQFMVI